MFDFPLPPMRPGLYGQLGLGPEATPDEINEATQELSIRIKQQQKTLQRRLDDVFQRLPELRDTYKQFKALETADNAGGSGEYARLHAKLARLEEEAVSVCKDFREMRSQADELEKKLHEVNLMAIQRPEDRLEYDRSHPPFELLKLADCGVSPLDDRKTVLAMVRAELSEFLEQSGETVFHPSDLTRQDFRDDYTHDPNLDRKR